MARLPLILALLIAACSTPPPAPRPQPLSGAETARRAGEATRQAEASGSTGVLIASSEDDAEVPDVAAPDLEPLPEPPVLRVTLTSDTAYVDGAPVELATYLAQQTTGEPKPHVVFLVPPDVPYGAVAEATDAARAAGLTRIAIEQAPTADESTDAVP